MSFRYKMTYLRPLRNGIVWFAAASYLFVWYWDRTRRVEKKHVWERNLFARYNVQWQVAREVLRPSCWTSLTYKYNHKTFAKINKTRMWANAQRDDRPAECMWHPLYNAVNFGWCPLLECRAVTLARPETLWNLLGCPKLANRCQLLWAEVHHIVRKCGETLLQFFPIVNKCLSYEDIARQSCTIVRRWRIFGDFWVLHFQRAACSTFQTCILNSQ